MIPARTLLLSLICVATPSLAQAQTATQAQDQSQIATTPPAPANFPVPAIANAPAQAPGPVQTTQTLTPVPPEPNLSALKPPPVSAPVTGGMPHWSEFPIAPKDIPTLAEFARRVHVQEANSAAQDAQGKAIAWEPNQPDSIAAAANALIDPAKMAPVDSEMSPQESEAFAKAARDKATAPPIAD